MHLDHVHRQCLLAYPLPAKPKRYVVFFSFHVIRLDTSVRILYVYVCVCVYVYVCIQASINRVPLAAPQALAHNQPSVTSTLLMIMSHLFTQLLVLLACKSFLSSTSYSLLFFIFKASPYNSPSSRVTLIIINYHNITTNTNILQLIMLLPL